MTKRTIKLDRYNVPVVWKEFKKGDPETCDRSTQGVTFPPGSKQGFSIVINTLYPVDNQKATLLHELWHVAEFEMDIERYSHRTMTLIMDRIWLVVRQNRWLKAFIWG